MSAQNEKRDPRTDPRPGDVLVLWHDGVNPLRRTVVDVYCEADRGIAILPMQARQVVTWQDPYGMRVGMMLDGWRSCMRNAEVVTVAGEAGE